MKSGRKLDGLCGSALAKSPAFYREICARAGELFELTERVWRAQPRRALV